MLKCLQESIEYSNDMFEADLDRVKRLLIDIPIIKKYKYYKHSKLYHSNSLVTSENGCGGKLKWKMKKS